MIFDEVFNTKPSGTAVLDFGSGASSAVVSITDAKITNYSRIFVELSTVPTAEHPVDDILIDPILVAGYDIVEGVGFTIQGRMANANANGTYNINWHAR